MSGPPPHELLEYLQLNLGFLLFRFSWCLKVSNFLMLSCIFPVYSKNNSNVTEIEPPYLKRRAVLINPFPNNVCEVESSRKTKQSLYFQNRKITVDVDLEVKQSQTGWPAQRMEGRQLVQSFRCLGTVEIVENLAYLQIYIKMT